MHPLVSALVSLFSFRFRRRASLELEVIALRHQLGVLRRKQKRRLHVSLADRILWSWLYWMSPQVLNTMVLVRPDTVVGWHRKGFRLYWTWRAQDKRNCPVLTQEIRELIRQMKMENPLWGVRRIHGELLKLGFVISTCSVHKCMPKRYKPPSPGWRMFLREHMRHTVAMDMFVVFTLTYKILYGMVLVHHKRRKIVHFAVTSSPSQDWLSQELVAACKSNAIPRYLLRDRDALYGRRFRECVRELGIQEIVAARQSPWQNIYVERVIGSIRSECLNHVIVMNEDHLRHTLSSYVQYYNKSRTHISLDKDCPDPRPMDAAANGKLITAIPEVGGLHHRYIRRAA